jgi:hypothetical protein
MGRHPAKFDYPKGKFLLILQNSGYTDEYYGVDELEYKKLRIILAKYGCRHCYHVLPDKVRLDLQKFRWNEACQIFQTESDKKVSVQLNTLEETIVEYTAEPQFYFF